MKKRFAIAILSCTAALAWQGPLYDKVLVTLPHRVIIGSEILEPGEYSIQEHKSAADTGILHVFRNGGMVLEATANTIDTLDKQTANETKVVLQQVGDDYYFDKIWIQGKNYGYEFVLPESVKSREREIRESVNVPARREHTRTTTTTTRTTRTSVESGEASRVVPDTRMRERLERQVRHELVMLPYYSVFDHLAYRVNGETVTLVGQVSRPTLKSSAENVVQDIEGVERVVNNIEVLPVSPNDDRIRAAMYRAIYGHTALNRYALQAVPPIHIIVNNGDVTLEGVVASDSEKTIAGMQAKGVPGVFSVTNNLRVE
jgi:hyperosmotically inducible protein